MKTDPDPLSVFGGWGGGAEGCFMGGWGAV